MQIFVTDVTESSENEQKRPNAYMREYRTKQKTQKDTTSNSKQEKELI